MGRRCGCVDGVPWSLHTGQRREPGDRPLGRWCRECRKMVSTETRRWIDRRSGAGEWDGEADDAVRAWEDGMG